MLYIFSIRYLEKSTVAGTVISDIPNNIPIYALPLKLATAAPDESLDIARPVNTMLGIIKGMISTERKLVLERKYPSIADMRHIRAELEAHNMRPEKIIAFANSMLISKMI